VADIKGGKINFRVDQQANLHFVIGRASFDEKNLAENYGAALDEILRAKPSSSKGRYLRKDVVSTTTGPVSPSTRPSRATSSRRRPRDDIRTDRSPHAQRDGAFRRALGSCPTIVRHQSARVVVRSN
jgi:hypothetical protein